MSYNNRWQDDRYPPRHRYRHERGGSQFSDGNSTYSRNRHARGNMGGANRHHGNRGFRNQFRDNMRPQPYLPHRNRRNEDNDMNPSIYKSPLELKIEKLVSAVQAQGTVGKIILMRTGQETAICLLSNACQNIPNCTIDLKQTPGTNVFELNLNNEKLAEGSFDTKQSARAALSNEAVDKLKKTCFYITKRNVFEEVTTGDAPKKPETTTSPSMEGSKAFQMMLKMGWGGKGLGAQEQGEQKTVADTIVENITKEGLGSKNVMAEVDNILRDFAASTKLTTLAFNSTFSKDERSQIHTIAAKYNLSSKSVGKDENRRITIKKKISKLDLVKELLRVGLENDMYQLEIPEGFISLWEEDKAS